MLSRLGAPSPESGLHLALGTSPCHALPALLATETPDRVAPSDIAGVDDRRDNEKNDEEQPRESNRGQNAVSKAAKDPVDA
ncbi:hypothetical protein C8D78_3728 [Arthrobacter oryzae]|uniref:Uncharacterized protein n=1 Tax=Arthrobacter oryzae TaxID=409290 RepID=A0A495E752_9MICC|nr:hypothetical protein C8D78_3728 [Arthrobacter oryzae]